MENILYSIGGILIPFVGTSLGSSMVFFMKKDMKDSFKKMIVGFASGVMIAASVWSLILPSVEMAEQQGSISWLPAAVGFALGVIFLICINKLAHKFEKRKNGKKFNMLTFSVTLHNIPEGMAVRSLFCRVFVRKCWYCITRSNCFSYRNCNSKYTRRSYYFNAIKNARKKQKRIIF